MNAAREAAVVTMYAKYPHLRPASKFEASYVTAAKNIRTELAIAFPGVKFSVKSKSYSMGNSIDVRWTDGPNTKQVDSIIQCYQVGTFNGMDDSYNYDEDRAFTDVFGGTKYTFAHRDYSDKFLASVIGRVARWMGGLDREPTVQDYRTGGLWRIKQSGGCDLDREVRLAISKHTCCVTRSA